MNNMKICQSMVQNQQIFRHNTGEFHYYQALTLKGTVHNFLLLYIGVLLMLS